MADQTCCTRVFVLCCDSVLSISQIAVSKETKNRNARVFRGGESFAIGVLIFHSSFIVIRGKLSYYRQG